jgi:hypothetical protein
MQIKGNNKAAVEHELTQAAMKKTRDKIITIALSIARRNKK